MSPVLEIENLHVRFATPEGEVPAVAGIDLGVGAGECLGVVGESGAGKSQIFLAAMGLLAVNGSATGRVRLGGVELLGLAAADLNRLRGSRMAMIFQDPMTALNPYLKVSRQLTEVLVVHKGLSEAAARLSALEMLERVRIPDARRRFDGYPHEFSGGMRQRVMVAMALLCAPELLIADEPTTALDVTVQAEILDLFREVQTDVGAAIVLITHDLGVVAGLCDRLAVMYAGRIVETGSADEVFAAPRHPYTLGLLQATPRLDREPAALTAIPGQPPDPLHLPAGCAFQDRCPQREEICATTRPELRAAGEGLLAACHLVEQVP
jgi:oligopeptide transport system ATP-binding protein